MTLLNDALAILTIAHLSLLANPLPPHLRHAWNQVEETKLHDENLALKKARLWGKMLAEVDMSQ